MCPSAPPSRHLDLPDPQGLALLVVDAQRAFTDPGFRTCPPGADAALAEIRLLLQGFREHERPVAFTRHRHLTPPPPGGMGSWWASFLLDGDPGAEFGPDPAPAPGESVFEKDAYSAYRGTGLEAWLRQGGCRSVVIAGFLTHVCVDTTARDAFMRGFDVVVASDACAAPCWRGLDLHATALAGLGHAVARVLPSERILDAMAHGPRAGS